MNTGKQKILYYLGAGASAKVLPLAKSTVKDTKSHSGIHPLEKEIELRGLALELEQFLDNAKEYFGDNSKVASIREGCKRLAREANKFGDVDTFAKYLFLQGKDPQLDELKRLLAQYFTIKQIVFGVQDDRYLPWLVGIMERRRFPEDIKVLSWNYDSQLQIAAEEFGARESVEYRGAGFGYQPAFVKSYPSLDPTDTYELLSIVHLNGRAGFIDFQSDRRLSIFQMRGNIPFAQLIDLIFEKDIESAIHFAWERSKYHRQLMLHALKMVDRVDIMVVIGYSFPFYNREIDKEIFEKIKADNTLRKIYYQDPKLDGSQLISQFGLDSSKIEIVHIPHTDNFHIPFEY